MVVKPAWILTYVEVGVFAFIRGDAQIRALKPLFGFPKRPQKPIVSSRGGGGGRLSHGVVNGDGLGSRKFEAKRVFWI